MLDKCFDHATKYHVSREMLHQLVTTDFVFICYTIVSVNGIPLPRYLYLGVIDAADG